MSNLSAKTILMASCCLFASCATTMGEDGQPKGFFEPIDGGVGIAMLTMDTPPNIGKDTQTAESGDIIYSQKTVIDHGAKLKASFSTSALENWGIKYSISPENLLFPLLIEEYGVIYCSREDLGGEVLIGGKYRFCLRDSDDDQKFDQAWQADENGFFPGYTSLYLQKAATNIPDPLPYSKIDSTIMPQDSFGIKYAYYDPLFGKPTLQFIAVMTTPSGETERSSIGDRSYSLDSIPFTASINEITIKVSSLNEKSIEYSIESEAEKGTITLIGRERAPKTTYVYY